MRTTLESTTHAPSLWHRTCGEEPIPKEEIVRITQTPTFSTLDVKSSVVLVEYLVFQTGVVLATSAIP